MSRDGGRSWAVSSKIEPGIFRSDPVLESDADGNFYYNSLTADLDVNDFWCHVYKMRSASSWWDNGTYAYGGDKQWMTIDRTDGPGRGNIYAFLGPSTGASLLPGTLHPFIRRQQPATNLASR